MSNNQINPSQHLQSALQNTSAPTGGTGAAQAALSQQQVYSQYPPITGTSFNGPWISSTDQLLIEIRDMLRRGKSRMG